MRAGDRATVSALRGALAAIENAEAVPLPAHTTPPDASHEQGAIAQARLGLGAGEADRRLLREAQVRDIVVDEQAAHVAAAEHLRTVGQADRAEHLLAQATALQPYLEP